MPAPVLLPLVALLAIVLPSTSALVAHDPPALNQRIIAYVDAHMGKKVIRGECWDLAAGALNESGAHWDGFYGFGKAVDWRKEEILPGDIVQFEGVETEHREGNSIQRDSYGKHTAIIYKVNERGDYIIAHQNFGEAGRKVSTTALRMADVRGGKLVFYRPAE